jgi:hypothetical protein
MALVSTVIQQCNQAVTSIVTRLLITDFYSESGVRHGEGQSIAGASAVLCEISQKIDEHVCLESF